MLAWKENSMRKYLLLSVLLLIANHIFSQTKTIDIYCKIYSGRQNIEYGGLEKILPDSLTKLHLFHPGRRVQLEIGSVNFMSLHGWKLVSSATQREGTTYESTYLMKKEIEITEDDYLLIKERYERLKYK